MKIDFNRFWIHDKIRTLSESWFDSRTSSFSGFVNVLLDKFVWAALLQSSTHETSFLTNPVQKRSVVGKQLVLFWTARPEHAHIHGASIHLRTRAIHRSHYILSHAIPIVDRFHIIWQTLSVWNIMLAMLHHIFYTITGLQHAHMTNYITDIKEASSLLQCIDIWYRLGLSTLPLWRQRATDSGANAQGMSPAVVPKQTASHTRPQAEQWSLCDPTIHCPPGQTSIHGCPLASDMNDHLCDDTCMGSCTSVNEGVSTHIYILANIIIDASIHANM